LVFGFFRDRELEDFAGTLANEMAERVPAKAIDTERAANPKFQSTVARAVENLLVGAQRYCRDRNPGVLKKARLSKSFQDRMIGLGYPKHFAKEITMALAKHLTQI
jgi:hypothetical protein